MEKKYLRQESNQDNGNKEKKKNRTKFMPLLM
jgi:hypothetical protein